MQNENKNFLDEIINDVSELEFKKIHNLIFSIVGLLSPTVPLIFLYKQDIVKEFSLIGVLVISITINAIIVLFLRVLFLFMDTTCLYYKVNRMSIKIKSYRKKSIKLDSKEEFIKKILEKEKNKFELVLLKLYLKIRELKLKSFDKKISRLECKSTKLNAELELSKEKDDFNMNRCFQSAILFNLITGASIIFFKVLTILNWININFKQILIAMLFLYLGIVLDCIYYGIMSWTTNLKVSK